MNAAGQGKAILLGEHAVLEGAPALVAGLDAGVNAALQGANDHLVLEVRPWGLRASVRGETLPDRALGALAQSLLAEGVPESALQKQLRCEARIPAQAGLGSSAALAVAVLRALLQEIKDPRGAQPAFIERLAAASEQVFHGQASGVDAALATRGGVGLYRREEGLEAVVPGAAAALVLVYTGPKPPTREAVAHVQSRCRNSASSRRNLQRLGDLSLAGGDLLREGKLSELGASMQEAQSLLGTFGLTTPNMQRAVESLQRAGALGAKLTGAGGGGCVLGLCEADRAPAVERALQDRGPWVATFPLSAKNATSGSS